MAEPKKKGLFESIGNLFSKKDEEAKMDEAKKKAAELAEQQQKAVKAAADKQAAQLAEARKEAEELAEKQRQAVAAEVAKKAEEAKAAAEAKAEEAKAKAEELAAAMTAEAEEVVEKVGFAKAAVIATHTVGANETLSHIALRYYGHATPPYYKVIYEFNKAVIGENMNIIRAGQVLEIPQLPQELAN